MKKVIIGIACCAAIAPLAFGQGPQMATLEEQGVTVTAPNAAVKIEGGEAAGYQPPKTLVVHSEVRAVTFSTVAVMCSTAKEKWFGRKSGPAPASMSILPRTAVCGQLIALWWIESWEKKIKRSEAGPCCVNADVSAPSQNLGAGLALADHASIAAPLGKVTLSVRTQLIGTGAHNLREPGVPTQA